MELQAPDEESMIRVAVADLDNRFASIDPSRIESTVRRLVRDLNIPVRIIGHPTIREPDGLALSSRNAYLNEQERQQAPFIQKTLREAEQELRRRPVSRRSLQNWMRRRIERGSLAKVDYVVAVDPETLKPKEPTTLPVLLAAAVFFGATRLIDNILVE